MMLNGLYVLVVAAVVMGAVHFIPRAFDHDRLWVLLASLDDEELAEMNERYPDLLERKWWK